MNVLSVILVNWTSLLGNLILQHIGEMLLIYLYSAMYVENQVYGILKVKLTKCYLRECVIGCNIYEKETCIIYWAVVYTMTLSTLVLPIATIVP